MVETLLAKLREKPRAYRLRLFVFLALGAFAASWIGNWSSWIDTSFKIYQLLQGALRGNHTDVQDTMLVLVEDAQEPGW